MQPTAILSSSPLGRLGNEQFARSDRATWLQESTPCHISAFSSADTGPAAGCTRCCSLSVATELNMLTSECLTRHSSVCLYLPAAKTLRLFLSGRVSEVGGIDDVVWTINRLQFMHMIMIIDGPVVTVTPSECQTRTASRRPRGLLVIERRASPSPCKPPP